MADGIAFSGHPLDRADHVRCDAELLAEARRDGRAMLLRLDGLVPAGAGEALGWMPLSAADGDAETVFLGMLGGHPAFAAVPDHGDPDPAFTHRRTWEAIGQLGAADLALYGGARSIVDWHARHRFCARCGQPTAMAKGGWQRDCASCGAQHFPRVDPVAIMLVEHDGALLLGRQTRFPPGRYSALAGFIEPGETIEEAVAREVMEEAGVRVRDVRYIASQPWPFPSQLMIGCHALADARDLTLDVTEIEDARWFTRAEVAEAMAAGEGGAFAPAPPQAIAHHMLRWWLEGGAVQKVS